MQLYWAYYDGILNVSLVFTYSIEMSEEIKICSSPSFCLGKRTPSRNEPRQLGTQYESDFFTMDILQLLCYLSDFGEDGSMWWELIPNTLKQVEQQLLQKQYAHFHMPFWLYTWTGDGSGLLDRNVQPDQGGWEEGIRLGKRYQLSQSNW